MTNEITLIISISIAILLEIYHIRQQNIKDGDPICKYKYHLRKQSKNQIRKLRSMPYPQYLLSEHWKLARRAALYRDQYKCKDCNSTTTLQVHHITYARRGYEKLSDLVTVCSSCHKDRHFL